MTEVFFDPPRCDAAWRGKIYNGDIIILSPTPEMLALVEHTRGMIEEAFAPRDLQRAHESLAVERCAEILSALKPSYIHYPRTKKLIQRVLNAFGCSSEKTYQDVPRLRCAFPKDYLTTGIAYAHHPHHDTWHSAPMCQFNWWAPIYEFVSHNGMAFHPRYWDQAVRIGSRDFNYYRWNAESRKNAAQHIGRDTRVQPHAEEIRWNSSRTSGLSCRRTASSFSPERSSAGYSFVTRRQCGLPSALRILSTSASPVSEDRMRFAYLIWMRDLIYRNVGYRH